MWKGLLICLVLMQVALSFSTKYDKVTNDQASNRKASNTFQYRGISAGMLIFLILLTIFIGMTLYYSVIFYPILCKKERNYDRMEMGAL